MQTKSAPVKSARGNRQDPATKAWTGPNGESITNGKVRCVVGTVTYQEYDSLSEAREKLTDDICLKHVNAQVETNAKNSLRANAVGAPSEKSLRNEAFQRILSSDEGTAKLRELSTDPAQMEAYFQTVISQIKAEKNIPDVDEEEEADSVGTN